MTLTKTNTCALIVDTRTSADDWCVFEHHVVLNEGEPPTIVLVGACKLVEVYRLVTGKTNSEWTAMFANGGKIMVNIIATTDDKQEAYRHAMEHVRTINPMPICNVRGHSLKSTRRAIICHQNGKRYDTQTEAANDLGIHASAISRHMAGNATHAQQFTFAYAPPETGAVS